jgi:DNA topoisomerase-1
VPKSLVIVESPAKARTIATFLGDDFVVESSIGHIRDLPKRASDVPPEFKKEKWARLGVDVDNDFKPLYVLDPEKKAQIGKLKALVKASGELYLATDEDREGESIAWHLLEVLKPKVPVRRMVFHEITKKAIEGALAEPRDIDRRLVDAQEARRILDRLYGYDVSPVLWKKVMPGLSAGRVQSVATRMVVARERDRIAFRAAGYWDIDGKFAAAGGEVGARLVSIDGVRLATGKDFDDSGVLTGDRLVLDEARARALAASLAERAFTVASLTTKPYKRSPSPPFMTSTLQQEAGRKLRFSAARTMRAAQRLYENGFITYMRTDSTTLSDAAIAAARRQIEQLYGQDFVPESPRTYRNKVKNAQEAHEAIRPAGDAFRTPDEVTAEVGHDEARIYELVWKRTLASQMNDAHGRNVQLRIATTEGERVEFAASGLTITSPGFLRAYVEGSDDPETELENRERQLPPLEEGESITGREFGPESHETQPPARYTEASLVRHLEELGVGRPSTYASIINTIVDRGYVWKKGTALVPSFTAFAVVTLLEQHFPDLVDYAFTARMEDELDQIAQGAKQTVPWLKRFYFGDDGAPKSTPPKSGAPPSSSGAPAVGLRDMVANKLSEIDAREINTLPLGDDPEGRPIVVRVGRFGPYLQRETDSANIPKDMPPDELTLAKAIEMLETPSGDRLVGVDPETGLEVFVRDGRFGAYVRLGEVSDDKEKPKTASLLRTMKSSEVTLEDALRLLTLPRLVGNDPEGKPIMAFNGRYGPYLERPEKDRRNLEKEEDVFTVTLEQALALYAQPRVRRQQQRQRVEPLRELGNDPVSGKPITLREGRFGPYVTDGETNATLRTGDDPDSLTPERAHELLQLRRERGPAPPKGKRRAAPKKEKAAAAPSEAAPKKKAAKKAPKKAAKKASKKKAAKAAKKATSTDAPKNGNGHSQAPSKKRPSGNSPSTTAP